MESKNALSNIFSEELGWGFMGLGIGSLTAYLSDIDSGARPIFVFFITLAIYFGAFYLIMLAKWHRKAKEGFVNIIPLFDGGYNEHEKFAWLEVESKNDFEKTVFYVKLMRITGKHKDGGESDYRVNQKYFSRMSKAENIPAEIKIASASDDTMFLLLDGKKVPFRVLLDEESNYSTQAFEIIFEIKGKTNGKYHFREFYKGELVFKCTTDPIVLVGQEQIGHRNSVVVLRNVERYDYEREQDRNINKEMVSVRDKMILSDEWKLEGRI